MVKDLSTLSGSKYCSNILHSTTLKLVSGTFQKFFGYISLLPDLFK